MTDSSVLKQFEIEFHVLKRTIFHKSSYRRSRSRSPRARGHHRRESRGRDYGESSRRRSRSVERDYDRRYR